ncbi:hypothetical protein H696_00089 [Fonticula alba]|uniref:DNA-directed RNA polymerase II subunit RPB9-like zinc ribbon domain-containing protein n=1 Tax=Fonticula alba TaxID=691883 RepID=A0A058ZEZ0_FONAL|nr:hypothetical protein H696_00089 [Fonticula alba]KCV72493.1 hypothetical protein H696_00089 [Fonticula alba]|eukprot:XP_009492194.1 hypothetical protein H696_00089 [Fonticula alba]
MRFCSSCNNILYPEEDPINKVLILKCRRQQCTFQTVSTDLPVVYTNYISRQAGDQQTEYGDVTTDPTLPRRSATCELCNMKTTLIFFLASRSPEADFSLIYVCQSCQGQYISDGTTITDITPNRH